MISSLELEGKAGTRPDIWRLVLGPYVQYCPCEASEQKPKSELKEIELSYCQHSICLKKQAYYKKNVKIRWKMTELCPINVLAQKWHLTYFVPNIYSNFDIQTKFKVNQTQISHSIPKKLQKLTKVVISKNPILPKCHPPKSLLLLHFAMNLSETFRIDVNMDFAHTNNGRFLI